MHVVEIAGNVVGPFATWTEAKRYADKHGGTIKLIFPPQ